MAEDSPGAESPVRRRASVVIPARNEARRIGEVVAAVRSQANTEVAVEVLVVDDGSTDGTAEAAAASGARVIRTDVPAPK